MPCGDDLGLGEPDQRGVDGQPRAFDAGPGGEVRHPRVGLEVLGPAIGIAAVVERVGAEEDVAGAEGLGPGQREREEDGVAGGDVGGRDALADLGQRRVLGHRHVGGERRAPEGAEVEVDHHVPPDAEPLGHAPRGLELDRVPLAVAHAQRVDVEPVAPRDGGGRGRVHPAAQQDDGFGLRSWRKTNRQAGRVGRPSTNRSAPSSSG